MNLAKLFETQKKLDERIYERFPGLKEEPWDWKVLALQVELGELANEWRGFKRWSEDNDPRTVLYRWEDAFGETYESPDDPNQLVENFPGNNLRAVNPLLEEYVDCLHLILSIGNELKINEVNVSEMGDYTEEDTTETFNNLFFTIAELPLYFGTEELIEERYKIMFAMFVGLGELHLGFTWNQIEQAYFEKNKINHARQENNY